MHADGRVLFIDTHVFQRHEVQGPGLECEGSFLKWANHSVNIWKGALKCKLAEERYITLWHQCSGPSLGRRHAFPGPLPKQEVEPAWSWDTLLAWEMTELRRSRKALRSFQRDWREGTDLPPPVLPSQVTSVILPPSPTEAQPVWGNWSGWRFLLQTKAAREDTNSRWTAALQGYWCRLWTNYRASGALRSRSGDPEL